MPLIACRLPRPAGAVLYATSRAERGTFAPSTVIRAGFACTFLGHEYGENPYCFFFSFL
jgi:hypothetical protein